MQRIKSIRVQVKILILIVIIMKKIMKILSNSVVSDSGTYKAYLSTDTINIFAKNKHNFFWKKYQKLQKRIL